MKETTLYDTLGVPPDVDDATLKKTYRKLAMKWHPDKHGGSEEAKIKFQEIGAAFDVLQDSEKRQIYDQYGKEGLEQGGGMGGGMAAEDIFAQFFGGGGMGMGGGGFGGGPFGMSCTALLLSPKRVPG